MEEFFDGSGSLGVLSAFWRMCRQAWDFDHNGRLLRGIGNAGGSTPRVNDFGSSFFAF
jgi:hypothetical protein